jgi:DNA-binding NtrC family response regulator
MSAAMRRVLAEIDRVAACPGHILLCGEAGTGREMVARAIHERSAFSGGPFVMVECAGQSPADLEAQLFATSRNPSGVERRSVERVRRSAQLLQSKGGTLHLRNVQDLPARLQMRLVRVLRDREVVLMDEGTRVDLDHRVITAGDPSLESAVEDGRISSDLYKRLCELRIDVPALRERREDIPDLAVRLVEQLCVRAKVPPKHLSSAAQSFLAALPWRGNAGELKGLLEVLVTRAASPTIELDDVLANVRLDGNATWLAAGGSLREARARFEREYIAAVVAQHSGRIPQAAKALGIQRSNLYRKMRHLRVRPGSGRTRNKP